MVDTEVYIINNKTLYDVLSELKNQFIFKIFHFQNKDVFLEYFNSKIIENFLILSSKDFKIQIDKNRLLITNSFPVKILKLIQNINIKILQSTFNFKSNIKINNYNLNLNSRELFKDRKFLKLTEKEIHLILFLVKEKTPRKVNDLQKNVWGYNNDLETHTVETHIYRLRKKIKKTFGDDKLIQTLKDGYLI